MKPITHSPMAVDKVASGPICGGRVIGAGPTDLWVEGGLAVLALVVMSRRGV